MWNIMKLKYRTRVQTNEKRIEKVADTKVKTNKSRAKKSGKGEDLKMSEIECGSD